MPWSAQIGKSSACFNRTGKGGKPVWKTDMCVSQSLCEYEKILGLKAASNKKLAPRSETDPFPCEKDRQVVPADINTEGKEADPKGGCCPKQENNRTFISRTHQIDEGKGITKPAKRSSEKKRMYDLRQHSGIR